ncbi:hypothetical protein VC83_06188 [Pseudogymnoascus destructans]|uniref:Uncharacterized protein n=1 Tax=Pseudogymnoascus destructans TaxID=655981 RepID=A0A177AC55_9PEZI|nr:uncharacterized protein VC83_06188 [Pseudogymnoascus destructans]OAF59002.1 hypothetical protein VC83_06188 [Pseudogymnoascus destructans]
MEPSPRHDPVVARQDHASRSGQGGTLHISSYLTPAGTLAGKARNLGRHDGEVASAWKSGTFGVWAIKQACFVMMHAVGRGKWAMRYVVVSGSSFATTRKGKGGKLEDTGERDLEVVFV